MDKQVCALCEASEDERPMVQLKFEGEAAQVCPGCMPALIHGLPNEEVTRRIRLHRVKSKN